MSIATFARRAIVAASLLGLGGGAQAQSYRNSCQELWVMRNSIYKSYGYCFNTQRAIAYFGNANCEYDNVGEVPVPSSQRARIAQIVRIEREKGCTG